MGLYRCNSSVLLLGGENLLEFLDGLSTNRINGPCTAPFTNSQAKIIDVCEILLLGERVVLVGFVEYKDQLVAHLMRRILGRNISITDVSHLNDVFIGLEPDQIPEGATVHQSALGWMMVTSKSLNHLPTWNQQQWDEHRVVNEVPFHGHEITQKVHPFSCGLEHLVHPDKGCYIGQEILTRMRSRGKSGKVMVRKLNPVLNSTTTGQTHSLCIERLQ
ncbi:hypothetical protein N9M68_01565 [Candidatus Poseidonia alphae]|nr:hypothetical protein [Candidatus Poseidonia alphae]MDA7788262.1 hypothetical protein [bacterium]MDA8530227.1 hypothetical protein [Candidatus Poseidonia alphae]MDA8639152.1 hypothetical protein [Candidatus Poseidonia alphae]MDA8748805.1 hypothetical protein [Candidatus Poseidonia alphae]